MSGEIALRFSTQAQTDIRRITSELSGLQQQIASGAKANDMQGFGSASARLLSARSLREEADTRASVMSQLQARFGVQSAALGQVSDAAGGLALAVRSALSAGDGRAISTDLENAFNATIAALNENWNGKPLFAGERQGAAGPIRVKTLDQLLAATTPVALFDEAERDQYIELGGAPVLLAAKASDMSTDLFDTLRDMKQFIVDNGGVIGQPINDSQQLALLNFVERLEIQSANFITQQGASGQLETRLEKDIERLQQRSDLLTKGIGEQTDADLGAVSIRLNTLMAQYEAAAKTFVDLSRMTLLNFLR